MIENVDINLMLRFKNGDQTAFRELVERHKLTVLNLCLHFTGNKDDADDLAQEVFIRVYQAAPNYEVKAAFTTWLYRITVNLCLNYQRRKKILQFFSLNHSKAIEDQIEIHARRSEIHDRPDTALERKELQNLVQRSIQSLPENQKTALILYCYQNLSYQEIADVMKTSVSAVESRLHRAKENLRKRLKSIAQEVVYD